MNSGIHWLRDTNWVGWIARIWSLLLFTFMIARIFSPDPYATGPVPLEDWFLLGFWMLAVVALVVAWRWPQTGAWLTIGLMALRELAWILLKGGWIVNFLIIWLVVLPPALLHLIGARQVGKARMPARS